MATDKPRFSITLDPETFQEVLDYKENNKLSTQSKAVQRLIELGIQETHNNPSKVSVFLSSDEKQLVEGYRELNKAGREYLRQTMEMAKRSYSGKDRVIPDLEAVEDGA